MKIFISYSNADTSFVDRLSQELEKRGVLVWRDVKDIKVGDSIIERVEEGIKQCNYFCIVLSSSSVSRPWVLKEYRTVLNLQLSEDRKGIQILPIKLDSCEIPELLRDIKYADFSRNFTEGLDSLNRALGVDSLVERALKYFKKEEEQEIDLLPNPKIIAAGVGGTGNRIINRLSSLFGNLKEMETLAINTDIRALDLVRADKKILIGKSITRGLGSGGDPEIGRMAAESSRETLKELLDEVNMLFICAAMGGGTGTGAAPVVAEIAKKLGAIVIAIVRYPFRRERVHVNRAENGLEKLKKEVDALIIVDNDKIFEYYQNLNINYTFSIINQIICEVIIGICDIINHPVMNVDLADIKYALKKGKIGTIIFWEGQIYHVKNISPNPLSNINYAEASSVLINIRSGPELSYTLTEEIMNSLTQELDSDASVIWGVSIDEQFKEKIRITAIAMSPSFDITAMNKGPNK